MIIAVNTRLLLSGKLEGIGWFSFQTLKRICKNHPEHKFYFIFDRPYSKEFIFCDNITPLVVYPPTRHPILWFIWFEIMIPIILRRIKADVFLSPDGMLSLNSKVPQVPVIHDINFIHNPRQLPFLVRKFYNYFFPKYARKAKKIATVSEYSKNDISKSFNIKEHKIKVCYNSNNEIYKPLNEQEKIAIRLKYTGGKEYFIFVGALNPRKNIPGLLKSYEIFRKNGIHDHKLVVVGAAMHLTGEIDETIKNMQYKNDVIFAGRLSVEELHKVMASAFALVYIPYFEGFGIPLVEAMACEIPIISSNTTSLPEVVGDAALMCGPNEHEKVAYYMKVLCNDESKRQELIQKGKKQCKKFSWDISAENLWECVIETVNNK